MARRKGAACLISKVIVLDTNVVSELMRKEPDIKVAGWLNAFAPEDVDHSHIDFRTALRH
jgi:hypothetical protein